MDVSIIFSPMDFAWFYNPYTGYREYSNNTVMKKIK
jgi:hypothetical protein